MTTDLKAIQDKLKAQGAVMDKTGPAAEIAEVLWFTVRIARPGMSLYFTDEPGVYRIPLERELSAYSDDVIAASLRNKDARIVFERAETTWHSHDVYIRIDDDATRETER